MKFFTSFEPAKCQPAPTGTGKEIDWQMKLVKGVEEYINAGEIDVYAQIQASASANPSIPELIAKYQVTQDPSIFEQRKDAQFFDLTKVPKDIFEMQALQREAQLKFDRLPIEIRDQYDNNLYNFIQDDKSFDKVRSYFEKKFNLYDVATNEKVSTNTKVSTDNKEATTNNDKGGVASE